jgi:hypothetical protein
MLLFLLIGFSSFSQTKDQIITKFGAIADGKTNNARIIQQLIDKVSANGGGRVVIPAGNFMSSTLFLKSNVELHLALGARLLGPTNRFEYPTMEGRPGIIMAKNQHHIAVTGAGIIDGQGAELMLDIFKKLRDGEMQQDSIWLVKRPTGRTMILNFESCTGVTVSGVTLKDATDWVQDYVACDSVYINGITVQSTAYWNNDGIDITDSKNVRITHSFINSSDDGICLKSNNPQLVSENIFIDSCTIRSSANGLKFGTASAGVYKNIKVRNLLVYDTYRSAIAIESVDGGSMEQIDIQNVVAKNTGNAIFIRLGHRNTTGNVGMLKNIYIANIKAEIPLLKPDQGYPIEGPPDHLRPGFDKMPIRPSHYHIYGHPYLPYNLIPASIVGIPGYPVQNVTLENIEIVYGGGASKAIANIPLDQITAIPENEANYPEFSMFGELPAWGLYLRHVDGIKLSNVKMSFKSDDFRPAIVADDAKNITLQQLNIPTAKELPIIYFNNSKNLNFKNIATPFTNDKAVVIH